MSVHKSMTIYLFDLMYLIMIFSIVKTKYKDARALFTIIHI